MRRLILIRHPATDPAGTFCGHSDPDLSTAGLAQLHALQRKLDRLPLDRLVSSELLRARRSAEVLARQHAIQTALRPALREQGYATFTPPRAEPYAHFTARISRAAGQWLQHTSCATLAIVTHRGVLQFLLQTNCGVDATAAWQLSSHYATALFCARATGADNPLTVRETWHPD